MKHMQFIKITLPRDIASTSRRAAQPLQIHTTPKYNPIDLQTSREWLSMLQSELSTTFPRPMTADRPYLPPRNRAQTQTKNSGIKSASSLPKQHRRSSTKYASKTLLPPRSYNLRILRASPQKQTNLQSTSTIIRRTVGTRSIRNTSGYRAASSLR